MNARGKNTVFTFAMKAVGAALFCASVFVSSGGLSDPHVRPKCYAFAVGVLFFALTPLVATAGPKRKIEVGADTISILATTLCAWCFARGLAAAPLVAFDTFIPLLALAAFFMFRVYRGELFVATVVACACVAESVWGIAEFVDACLHGAVNHHISGTFDNSAGFAALLCMGVPFAASLSGHGRLYRCVGAVGVVLPVVAVGLSGSRSGVAALAAMALVYAVAQYRRYITRRVAVVAILLSVGLSAGLFLLKKDSAVGRLLIWRVGVEMAVDDPIAGKGPGSFMGKYMPYQAEYFADHPGSRYVMLADNTKYAFNEYLAIAVEYGAVALALSILLLCALLRGGGQRGRVYVIALSGLAVFSLFSYPLRYPPVWILAIYCAARVSRNARAHVKISMGRNPVRISGCVLAVVSACLLVRDYEFDTRWQRLFGESLAIGSVAVIDDYAALARQWNGNPFFLYNYAALLSDAGHTRESTEILLKCLRQHDDYNVQMLLADNYLSADELGLAERHYDTARLMCPNRFLPLQGLLRTFVAAGKSSQAVGVAREILRKEEKVPSYTVSLIRYEARKYLSEHTSAQDNAVI